MKNRSYGHLLIGGSRYDTMPDVKKKPTPAKAVTISRIAKCVYDYIQDSWQMYKREEIDKSGMLIILRDCVDGIHWCYDVSILSATDKRYLLGVIDTLNIKILEVKSNAKV